MSRFGSIAGRIVPTTSQPTSQPTTTTDSLVEDAVAPPEGALGSLRERMAAKVAARVKANKVAEALSIDDFNKEPAPLHPDDKAAIQARVATLAPVLPPAQLDTNQHQGQLDTLRAELAGATGIKAKILAKKVAALEAQVGILAAEVVHKVDMQATEAQVMEQYTDKLEELQEELPAAEELPQPEPTKPTTLAERIAARKIAAQAVEQKAEEEKAKTVQPSQVTHAALMNSMNCAVQEAVGREAATKSLSLAERLAIKRNAADQASLSTAGETKPSIVAEGKPAVHRDVHAPANRATVVLNKRQGEAVEKAIDGKTFSLIGAAGTGKTTSVRQLARELLESGMLGEVDYKRQGGEGRNDRVQGLSIAFVAFTRRAANNLRDSICADEELKEHFYNSCQTIHNLLEFYPEQYSYEADDGELRESMRFVPAKGAWDKLDITHLVIEEGSMVGLDLADMLMQALQAGVQIIYIGDINQLPPVFGASILSYALVKLPIVELTEVYRQALDSGIIRNAHNILAGRDLEFCDDFVAYEEYAKGRGLGIKRVGTDVPKGGTEIQAGPHKISLLYAQLFEGLYGKGDYDPDQDIILSPFNKHDLGTTNLNNHIAQFLGKKRDAVVYEVITGFEKWYLAVGDRVMVDKQDGTIKQIAVNATYSGTAAQPPGTDLTRFGVRTLCEGQMADMEKLDYSNFNVEAALEEDAGERKRAASHVVTVELDTGSTLILMSAGDFSQQRFSLGYCLTVHKAQGCEWRTVYFIMHKSHHVSATRELFYTGVTRAREKCVVLAKDYTLKQAVSAQRIKGNSTYEKIEYFNSGALADLELVQVEK